MDIVPVVDNEYALSSHRFYCRKPVLLDKITGRTLFYTDINETLYKQQIVEIKAQNVKRAGTLPQTVNEI